MRKKNLTEKNQVAQLDILVVSTKAVLASRLFRRHIMAVLKHEFTMRLSDEVYDQAVEMAKKQRRSMTNFIEFALQEYMAQLQPPGQEEEAPSDFQKTKKPRSTSFDLWNDYFWKDK